MVLEIRGGGAYPRAHPGKPFFADMGGARASHLTEGGGGGGVGWVGGWGWGHIHMHIQRRPSSQPEPGPGAPPSAVTQFWKLMDRFLEEVIPVPVLLGRELFVKHLVCYLDENPHTLGTHCAQCKAFLWIQPSIYQAMSCYIYNFARAARAKGASFSLNY